jgi:hypothetical protein
MPRRGSDLLHASLNLMSLGDSAIFSDAHYNANPRHSFDGCSDCRCVSAVARFGPHRRGSHRFHGRSFIEAGHPFLPHDQDFISAIDPKLHYKCSFEAAYPASTNPLQWKITRKELKLKRAEFTGGAKVFGWLSVSFDEIDSVTKVTKSYKIEGYFKPVLQHRKP